MLGATSLVPNATVPTTASVRSLVATFLLALTVPMAIWAVSYPWIAAAVVASFVAGGLAARVHAANTRPGRAGAGVAANGADGHPRH